MAVHERTQGLMAIAKKFCTALAQIIVTVMEQFKEEVVAGSDYGKVSKNDTHAMIAKKIRDTQRKFQSSLLAYIKLIELLAALSPEMLPALRDAYAELVSEGILMKKRCKGKLQKRGDQTFLTFSHSNHTFCRLKATFKLYRDAMLPT